MTRRPDSGEGSAEVPCTQLSSQKPTSVIFSDNGYGLSKVLCRLRSSHTLPTKWSLQKFSADIWIFGIVAYSRLTAHGYNIRAMESCSAKK